MDYKQILVDFVEGRMPFAEFHDLVLNDDLFAAWIDQHVPSDWKCYTKATPENNYTVQELPFSIRHMSPYRHPLPPGVMVKSM